VVSKTFGEAVEIAVFIFERKRLPLGKVLAAPGARGSAWQVVGIGETAPSGGRGSSAHPLAAKRAPSGRALRRTRRDDRAHLS
jgi:hypothetical protein